MKIISGNFMYAVVVMIVSRHERKCQVEASLAVLSLTIWYSIISFKPFPFPMIIGYVAS